MLTATLMQDETDTHHPSDPTVGPCKVMIGNRCSDDIWDSVNQVQPNMQWSQPNANSSTGNTCPQGFRLITEGGHTQCLKRPQNYLPSGSNAGIVPPDLAQVGSGDAQYLDHGATGTAIVVTPAPAGMMAMNYDSNKTTLWWALGLIGVTGLGVTAYLLSKGH